MTASSQSIPKEIQKFGEHCSQGLLGLTDNEACIEFTRKILPELLLETSVFYDLMEAMVHGKGYPDLRRPTMFDNEVLLYTDSRQLFSLRMYLWGPGEYTDPHDHNAWGVIGTVLGGYEVINYRREDDESREGYAQLTEIERFTLTPGQTTFTLPFNQGIHTTGNPTTETIITLNLYGRALPRGYLNRYDLGRGRVYRVLPPRLKKKRLAAQALKSFTRNDPSRTADSMVDHHPGDAA